MFIHEIAHLEKVNPRLRLRKFRRLANAVFHFLQFCAQFLIKFNSFIIPY